MIYSNNLLKYCQNLVCTKQGSSKELRNSAAMYFMPKPRYNPATQNDDDYLTFKESYRDKSGRIHTLTLLTVGFLSEEVRPKDVRDIAKALSCRYDSHGYVGKPAHVRRIQRMERDSVALCCRVLGEDDEERC